MGVVLPWDLKDLTSDMVDLKTSSLVGCGPLAFLPEDFCHLRPFSEVRAPIPDAPCRRPVRQGLQQCRACSCLPSCHGRLCRIAHVFVLIGFFSSSALSASSQKVCLGNAFRRSCRRVQTAVPPGPCWWVERHVDEDSFWSAFPIVKQ